MPPLGPPRPPDVPTTAPHPRAAPAAAPAPGPGPQYPPWYLTPQQQQAMALQQAQAFYQPLLDELHRQQQQQAFEHLAQQAGLGQMYSALGGSFGGLAGNLQNIYNQAAQGLAQYSQGSTSPNLGIMQQGLQGQGTAYAAGASKYPQLAGQQGVLQFLTAVQQANAQDAALSDRVSQTAGEIPAKAQALLGGIQEQQYKMSQAETARRASAAKMSQQAYQSARSYALATAKYYTDKTGFLYVVKDTPKGPQLVEAQDAQGRPISTRGLTPYQKAQLTVRHQSQASLNRYRRKQLVLSQQRVELSKKNAAASRRQSASRTAQSANDRRKSRLQHRADQRTKATGYLWEAGPNGIHPVRGPNGKPVKAKKKAASGGSGGGSGL